MNLELMHALQDSYGFLITESLKIDRGLRGIWRLETAQGTLACKWYDPEISDLHTVHRSLLGSRTAHNYGIATPQVLLTKMGHSYITLESGWYVVYEFVSGRTLAEGQFNRRSAAAMGRTIAQLGRALATIDGDLVVSDLPWPLDLQWGQEHLKELIEKAESREFGANSQRSYAAFVKHLALYERSLPQLQGVEVLPQQWVHGDCNPSNFHFDDNHQLTAVMDFDNVSFLAQGFDFMYALNQSFRHDKTCIVAALEAYLEIVPVSPADLACWGPMWLYYSFLNLWPHNVVNGISTDSEHDWQDLQDMLTWWIAHMDAVTELFVKSERNYRKKILHR